MKNNHLTDIILKNKKKILSNKNNYQLNIKDKKKIYTSELSKSKHIITKKYEKKIKEAYIIMKQDINVQILEKKFNIEWTKKNIFLI
ncbi:hypothetical protein [Buchnera aphidicola]|uniref:hypothetical protein n=1 Tax=Buchnera aphidicola TaxID=9 RepID=UPI003BEF10AE